MLRLTILAASVAMAVVLFSTPAAADPVRIVTSGGVSQIPQDGETGFALNGAGLSINGGEVVPFFAQTCSPCAPGTSLNLSSAMTMHLNTPGSATVNGTTFDNVFFGGVFAFIAGSVTVPNIPPGGPGLPPSEAPTTEFTFFGNLQGFADPGLTTLLFTTQLTGRGIASVGFFNEPLIGGGSGVFADGFNDEFTSGAATPEPASLFLFGSGAAWLAARRRRRRD